MGDKFYNPDLTNFKKAVLNAVNDDGGISIAKFVELYRSLLISRLDLINSKNKSVEFGTNELDGIEGLADYFFSMYSKDFVSNDGDLISVDEYEKLLVLTKKLAGDYVKYFDGEVVSKENSFVGKMYEIYPKNKIDKVVDKNKIDKVVKDFQSNVKVDLKETVNTLIDLYKKEIDNFNDQFKYLPSISVGNERIDFLESTLNIVKEFFLNALNKEIKCVMPKIEHLEKITLFSSNELGSLVNESTRTPNVGYNIFKKIKNYILKRSDIRLGLNRIKSQYEREKNIILKDFIDAFKNYKTNIDNMYFNF